MPTGQAAPKQHAYGREQGTAPLPTCCTGGGRGAVPGE